MAKQKNHCDFCGKGVGNNQIRGWDRDGMRYEFCGLACKLKFRKEIPLADEPNGRTTRGAPGEMSNGLGCLITLGIVLFVGLAAKLFPDRNQRPEPGLPPLTIQQRVANIDKLLPDKPDEYRGQLEALLADLAARPLAYPRLVTLALKANDRDTARKLIARALSEGVKVEYAERQARDWQYDFAAAAGNKAKSDAKSKP